MSLSENINRYLENNGIMKNFLAEKTGMTQNAVSLSLNGKRKLSADEYISICQALNVPLETFLTATAQRITALDTVRGGEVMSSKRISVAEAAKIMGVSPQFVRIGLQRNLLPFGFATNMGGGCRYTYYINPKEFQEYLGLNNANQIQTVNIQTYGQKEVV